MPLHKDDYDIFKDWHGCKENGTPTYWWLEFKMMQSHQKAIWQFPKKLNKNLHDPETLSIDVYQGNNVYTDLHIIFTVLFLAANHPGRKKRMSSHR